MLEIRALGTLEIRDDDGVVDTVLAQSKRAALLVYLACARPRGYHRRDTLLALFWPDLDEAHARNALSQALSFLRRELPPGVLVTRGGGEIGVDSDSVRCDVAGFEEAVTADRWGDALELYQGDLLAGLHVAEAPEFDRWLEMERTRLRDLAADAAWRLGDERVRAGSPAEAERAARRALALSPTDEASARSFMEVLAASGDRAMALRFYEELAAVMNRELEVQPAPETTRLAEAIRNGELAVAQPDRRPRIPVPEPPSADGEPTGTDKGAAPHGSPTGASPRSGWRSRGRAVALAVGAVLIAGGLLAAEWVQNGRTGGPGTLIGRALVSAHDEIVVADLESPFDSTLGVTASEWLRTEIAQSDIMEPVGSTAIGAALRRLGREHVAWAPLDSETAREIAIRDGYPLVVAGEINRLSDQYIVTVRLEDPRGEVLGRFNGAAVSDADFVAVLDRIGEEIRQRVGESRAAIRRSPPLAQVTTASLEALRLYTVAARVRDWEGRPEDAVPLLEQAIALDSGFAAAHLKLGVTLNNMGIQEGREADLRALAWRNRDRLTPLERLRLEDARAFAAALADPSADECQLYEPGLQLYETYVRRHPADIHAWHNYAWHLDRMGRTREAIERYRMIVESGRASPLTYANLFGLQLQMGDRAGAVATEARFRDEFPGAPQWLYWEAVAAMHAFDYRRADSLLTEFATRQAPSTGTIAMQARVDVVLGRTRDAESHYRAAADRFDRNGYASRVASDRVTHALARLVAWGDTTGALRDADAVLERARSARAAGATWIDLGLLYALAGQVERAQTVHDTLVADSHASWARVRGLLRGAIALAEGAPERAGRLAADTAIGCAVGGLSQWGSVLAGRAHELAGRPDAASIAYEAFLDARREVGDPSALDGIFLFDTLERLGGLHDRLGHLDEAARYYARAAELWKDADPELQPRVRRLQERAAALIGEGGR